MDIGLTSPYAHPHVHRGSERYFHDLATWLVGRGHNVSMLSTTSGPSFEQADESGAPIRFVHRGRPFGRGRLSVDELLRTIPAVARGAREMDASVIQAHHHVDAAGVRLGRRARTPYVIWMPGAPPRSAIEGKPLHRAAFRFACAGAARIHTLSAYAAAALRDEYGVETHQVPPGVHTERYAGPKETGGEPVILCTSAAGDPRKRVELLVRAFPKVLADRPDARLVLATTDAEAAHALLAGLDAPARDRAEVRTGLDTPTLARLYRDAAVSALPSVREAFGLVVVESLAAGTPVVATDDGALPEIITDDSIGRLFPDADVGALAVALVGAIELSADPATAGRCRTAAHRWDWEVVGPEIEEIYGRLAS